MTNILHIIQALGCGGGPRALIATAKHSARIGNYKHSIASLLPVDSTALELANQAGFDVFVPQDNAALFEAIEQADIIHVNFWNTPEMYELFRSELPEMRLIIWFHIGGSNAPQIITSQLVDFADFALPCSPFTHERQAFMELSPEERVEKTGVVYGAADFDRILGSEPKEHKNFNVGYIGTATLAKMHPNFVSMSAKIDIPNLRFVVCGHTEDIFPQQAQDMGVTDRFDFRGYVTDILKVYETLDVFGYPLCPETYAAAELTLQESMYLGIPPVVFPYGGIKNLVVNDFTGLVVHSELEYKQAIEYLYHNTEERLRMGRNCSEYAKQIFGAENAARKLNPIYERMLQKPKRKRQWTQKRTLSLLRQPVTLQNLVNKNQDEQEVTGAEKFIESLGDKAEDFITSMNSQDTRELFQAERRIACSPRVLFGSDTGGILQYEGYYPRDSYLRLWAGLVWQQLGEHANALSDFQSAINVGFNHWRVYWYLAQSAEKVGNMILTRKSLDTVLQKAPEFTDAQEMSLRIGEIETGKENGAEKFSTQCPHCGEMLYIDRHGSWQCPRCKKEFVV